MPETAKQARVDSRPPDFAQRGRTETQGISADRPEGRTAQTPPACTDVTDEAQQKGPAGLRERYADG